MFDCKFSDFSALKLETVRMGKSARQPSPLIVMHREESPYRYEQRLCLFRSKAQQAGREYLTLTKELKENIANISHCDRFSWFSHVRHSILRTAVVVPLALASDKIDA